MSTAYYAMFHELCHQCADLLVGKTKSTRSPEAWRQAYRALDHGFAKNQCKIQGTIAKFPNDIQDFADRFVSLQEKRHAADYDPDSRFKRSDVISEIDQAEHAIENLRHVPTTDRRAFVIWLVMKNRKD